MTKTARPVPEWVGRTPTSKVPDRVRDRIFIDCGGKCHRSSIKIQPGQPWELDHIIALVNWTGPGHGNRESNLAPILVDKHKEKTAEDVAEKARAARIRKKHIGASSPSSRPIPGSRASGLRKRMNGRVERW